MKYFTKQRLLLAVKVLIPLLILTLVIYEGGHFFKGIDFGLLKKNLTEIGAVKFILILSFGLAALLPMSFYDVILLKILNRKVPGRELFGNSFMANAFSNFLGFGGLTGAALRTYFYKTKEQSRTEIVKGIARISLFYLSGLSLLCWMVLTGILSAPFIKSYKWLFIGIIAIALYLPVLLISYTIQQKRQSEKKISLKTELQLIMTSFGEWAAALLTIWGISEVLGLNISLADLAPIYIAAACAGVISLIPSGIGSFDFVFLLNLGWMDIPKEKILLLLLLYRISYNFFPWFTAACLLCRKLWKTLNKKWNQLPSYMVGYASHWVITLLVFLSGVTLLLSAAFPSVLERVKFLHHLMSDPVLTVSHQLSVAMGTALLALARGIEYRVKWAYYVTFTVLVCGSIFTFIKGFDYEEALFILGVAFLLFLSRGRFYRLNFVPTWGRIAVDFLLVLFFVGLYFYVGYIYLPDVQVKIPHVLDRYLIQDSEELFRSGFVGIIIAWFVLAIGYFASRPSHFTFERAGPHFEEIKEHFTRYGGSTLSHLTFLNDKYIYWNKSRDVLLVFQKFGDKLVILGNPTGNEEQFISALEEFQDRADLFGLKPVYYQISSTMLPYLHSHGFDFFKLGEEARIELSAFSLEGSKMKYMRFIKNKFNREGVAFEVLHPPFSAELMEDIKNVSDLWLDGRREKGFSLGFFDKNYINISPLALLKDKKGKVLAFATFMPMYDDSKTLSIDLMRFLPYAEKGIMDYLFISLFQWGREHHYSYFNLGMAPLFNVGLSKYSFASEKIAALIYQYGHFLYHFQGLKSFKEKYASSWEPKYLAFRRKSSLPAAMVQLSLLISSRGKKR
ncbi:bifunctional lysylphosphatidylglycerol flippase/synthetase MprF [Peribacillus kribbensis]|uniref:bifunctional lysylphosphatidylglycerol flippase/synthetase MprF n=1 Tax=Peribacillus kribbensis TaxID=356658 RepID=UPI0003FB4DB3|nr:bifunctional lysylphosphatidylglycerol flippase/synthetase MprF [Peribacillus kribbensis]